MKGIILGNNDFFSCLDKEKELMIGRYKTLLTHGHYYNVSVGAEYLKQEARDVYKRQILADCKGVFAIWN